MQKLEKIVREFEPGSLELAPKRERLWTKFRMTTRLKQLEKFQRGLSEVRSTLMLGLMYQNIQKPRLCFTNEEVQIVKICAPSTTDTNQQLRNPVLTKTSFGYDAFSSPSQEPTASQESTGSQEHSTTSTTVTPKNYDSSVASIVSSNAVQSFLQHSLHLAVDELFASGTVQQLMDSTVNQVTSFDTACVGSYEFDSYDIRRMPVSHKEVSPDAIATEGSASQGPRLSRPRTRVCHQKSSIGVVLGSIWIRTSTLKAVEESNVLAGKLEVATSFIFYPASWLNKIGLRYGTEANLQYSHTTGWKFNVTAVRAMPESSLIFELCRQGNVQGVQLMFNRGEASVKDTSPKGWTPLHFAAASGHVDLCAALLKAGAERTALAYEGPTEDALSPITIWSELCPAVPPLEKIRMMRLFGVDSLDLSEPNGDGWIVSHNLVASMSKEQSRVANTTVVWSLRQKQSETLVAFSAASVWYALQQAVRSFLIEEHETQILHHLLRLGREHHNHKIQSHVSAIGHWLALRASRDLLSNLLQAGQFLRIDGFDSFEGADAICKRQFVQLMPYLFNTWAKRFLQSLENMKGPVEAELDFVLGELLIDRESLARCIQMAIEKPPDSRADTLHKCLSCGDDYVNLGTGLVQPRKISFNECRITGHKFFCQCSEFLRELGVMQGQPVADSRDIGDVDIDEEYFKETEDDLEQLCNEYDERGLGEKIKGDPFHDAAMILYQVQGRRWISSYKPSESLCATCFLKREEYIGENGPTNHHRCTPVPKTFISSCSPDHFNSTF